MRILLAAKTMGVGGLERIVVGLARELSGRHHQVWVVSSGGDLVADLRPLRRPSRPGPARDHLAARRRPVRARRSAA